MYNIDCSVELQKQIKTLFLQSCAEGRGEAFLAAIKHIYHRLQKDPKEFGEPLYRLKSLRIQVRTTIVLPLSVDFAVSQYHDNVIIRFMHLIDNRTK